MKTLTVSEAEGRLGQLLVEAPRGYVIVLTDGNIQVTLTPRDATKPLDPEVDSQELEAELLRAIDGPYRPYSGAIRRGLPVTRYRMPLSRRKLSSNMNSECWKSGVYDSVVFEVFGPKSTLLS